ncbi:sugar ABC transporter permease [Cohnella sp. LGH]|nr:MULTISPECIES: ABC transporter permease subunit [Cohnella]QTH40384.1 sugar ABC transporter permease [Cohnella sp. LGH]
MINMNLMKKSKNLSLHLMLLPAMILLIVFSYIPMAGISIAFQDFIPAKGLLGNQEWVGLKNFELILSNPFVYRVLQNTLIIAFAKILLGLVVPIVFAIFLNEIRNTAYKRTIQTLVYLPHFLSWVLLAGILIDILSPSTGIVNNMLKSLGMNPIFFLGDPKWFQPTIILTDVWKEFGWSTILYLAAITSIDPSLYESAKMDGAGRFRQMLSVTLPGMSMIIAMLAILSIGNILNAGFDQIFNLYHAGVYETGDIIDTFVYRMGLIDAKFGPATAVGLFKSVVSLILISVSYYCAYRFADYRIF